MTNQKLETALLCLFRLPYVPKVPLWKPAIHRKHSRGN